MTPAARQDGEEAGPRRIVALGGGTGLPAVLRGLRRRFAQDGATSLTAVVTMTDDGGSSGRLRETTGLPPPGDVRKCLVALAEEEDLLAAVFQHRYEPAGELGGHSLGNLILAALAQQTGSFVRAVEVSSSVLRTAGRILPVTQDAVSLEATLADGTRVVGETAISRCGKPIRRVGLTPRTVRTTPGVVEAILEADLVSIGPGSLYTSVVPNLLVDGVAEALRRTAAPIVVVGNLVSEPGETTGLDLADHLAVIEEHAGGPIVDGVLVNAAAAPADVLARYRAEGAEPLYWPARGYRDVRIVQGDLLGAGAKLRHDSDATAAGLLAAWSALAHGSAVGRRA